MKSIIEKIRKNIERYKIERKASKLEESIKKEDLFEAAKLRYQLENYDFAYQDVYKVISKKIDEINYNSLYEDDISFLNESLKLLLSSYAYTQNFVKENAKDVNGENKNSINNKKVDLEKLVEHLRKNGYQIKELFKNIFNVFEKKGACGEFLILLYKIFIGNEKIPREIFEILYAEPKRKDIIKKAKSECFFNKKHLNAYLILTRFNDDDEAVKNVLEYASLIEDSNNIIDKGSYVIILDKLLSEYSKKLDKAEKAKIYENLIEHCNINNNIFGSNNIFESDKQKIIKRFLQEEEDIELKEDIIKKEILPFIREVLSKTNKVNYENNENKVNDEEIVIYCIKGINYSEKLGLEENKKIFVEKLLEKDFEIKNKEIIKNKVVPLFNKLYKENKKNKELCDKIYDKAIDYCEKAGLEKEKNDFTLKHFFSE